MTTPRTASFGTRVWAHSSWQASHRLRQKASGSFSSQPGCGRLVGVDGDLGFVQQVAVQVEQQGAHALGAVVDGQDAGDGHGAVRSQAVRCVGRLMAPASGDAAAGHRPLHLRIDVSML
jgi:hypothetical protein